MIYSAVELERFNELRNRIKRLRIYMARSTFKAPNAQRRRYVARQIANRIMELERELPSNRPPMPKCFSWGGDNFAPIKRLDESTVKYKRHAERDSIVIDFEFRPDIYAEFKHLFE